MQTRAFEPKVLVLPRVSLNYQLLSIQQEEEPGFLRPLAEKGLDRLTEAKVEHIICTSALSAHI